MQSKYTTWVLTLTFACLMMAEVAIGAEIIDIKPQIVGSYVPITRVSYTQSWDNETIIQTDPATGVISTNDNSVFINWIEVNVGTAEEPELLIIDIYNFEGAEVRNVNFTTDTTGVAVWQNGTVTTTSNLDAWKDAMIGTTQDSDMMNYVYYDGTLTNMPVRPTADFDLLFRYSFVTTDYIVVMERDGNTFFELTAIGADGNPIEGANILRFGHPTLGSHLMYDWRTGYAAQSYFPGQDMGFTVASIAKFFEDTDVDEADQFVYGFRIANDGNADVKFFGASDDPFTNNPINPLLIPEPATAGLLALGTLVVLRRRSRQG